MKQITHQLIENDNLVKKIESISSLIEVQDDNQKAMLFTGFLQNAISHYHSMNILIEKELYNSAFSLVRVLFENIIRAEYMNKYLSDEQIEEMYVKTNWDKIFTKSIGDMAKEIDEKYGQVLYSDAKSNAYKMMNEYTHTGHNQIARWFNEESGKIEPNFDDGLIVDTLKGNYILLELFAKHYIEYMKQSNLLSNEVNL